MSDGASTEPRPVELTPLIRNAARGELPEWARMRPERREHVSRVVALMEQWAGELGLSERDRDRWSAAAWLHDSLRDADPEELRAGLPQEFQELPPLLLHGPAAAARVGKCADPALLDAIRYHTIGHPSLDLLGKALYLADFLDPGRDFSRDWRAGLRRRMPDELDGVLVEVVAARIEHLIESRKPIRPETASFWSSLVDGSE